MGESFRKKEWRSKQVPEKNNGDQYVGVEEKRSQESLNKDETNGETERESLVTASRVESLKGQQCVI